MQSSGKLTTKIVGMVLAICLCTSTVPAAPAQGERWTRPCGGSLPAGKSGLILTTTSTEPSVQPDADVAFHLKLKAQDLMDHTRLLKNRYASERIQSQTILEDLDSRPTTLGFPNLGVLDTQSRFEDLLLEDYKRVSVIAAFVQMIKKGDSASVISPDFHNDFRKLESFIYTFLCHLGNAITDRYTGDMHYVTSDVIPASLKTTASEAERSDRDYRILHDARTLFASIEKVYSVLSS